MSLIMLRLQVYDKLKFIKKLQYIMIQINNDSDMHVQLESPQLKYQASDVEGQCKISSITCVKRQIALFFLFILSNIIFICLPLLFTSWFTHLKRLFYYRPCPLSQATHFHIINYDGITTFAKKKEQLFYFSKKKFMKVIYFDNRYLRYIVYNNHVEAARFNYIQRVNQIMNSNNVQKQSYQNQTDVLRLRHLYGEGSMKLKYLPFYRILFQQLIRPLHIFIVFSCSLWFYEKYYYYSSIILVTLFSGIFMNAYQIYQNNKRIFQLAYYKQQISALRNGQIVKIQSTQLVPGDIVFLKKNKKIPFDGIILQGNALVNQSSLTGESVHVLRGSYIENINNQLKNCHICDGSILVNISNKKKYQKFQHYRELGIPIMVKNTNFTTIKGQIIRIIAFPRQKENIFQNHSTKLLLIMFAIAIISFIVLIVRLVNEYENEPLSKRFQMFFVKFLDLIVITVPPCITITMTSSTILAIRKLQDKKILCRIPTKINEGGLVNLACFDKTGILTKDFMNFQCLHLYNDKQFDAPVTYKENLDANFEKIMKRNKNFIHALNNISMVHEFTYIQSTKQLVGDLQQKELFQHFEYQLQNQSMVEGSIMCFKSKRGINGSVFRRFQYDCFRFIKSAIGKSNKTGEQYYLYAKGAPQQIKRLLNPSKIPQNFDKILKFYTSQGFRVIAIGSRKVDEQSIRDPREELQNNLSFDGFQVFQSQLKQHTKQSIQEILKAHVSCVMITGDNPLTACNVAFKCGIANPFKKTQIYDIYKNSLQQQQFKAPSLILQQRDKHYYSDLVGSSQILFNNRSEQQIKIKKQHFQLNGQRLQEQISKNIMNPNIQFCLTGPAFNFLFRNSNQQLTQIQRNILSKTTIFARANPNDKIKIVYLYKKIGKKVLMCGDGANDCGALRQANIGLSLSNGQAEISAPFSSQNNNITVVVQLLKQCRAALVTQFSLFNSLALYSLIQYTTTISAQFHYSYPYDFQYLYWDVFCSLIFFLTYGKTKTAKKLSSQIPSANLVSISNITKILIIFLFQLVGQVLVLQGMHQFFIKNLENQVTIRKQIIVQGKSEIKIFPYSNTLTYQFFKKDLTLVTSHSAQNSALFLFTNIMYIYSILAFFVSSPWRRKFFTNPIFLAFLIVMLTYNLIMIVVPESRISIFDSDMLVSKIYNWYIFGLAVGIGFIMYFILNFFYQPFFKWLKNKYPEKQWI